MKVLPVGLQWGVAIDGKFVAMYNTEKEAWAHNIVVAEEPVVVAAEPRTAREVPEIPQELPEDLKIVPPYEKLD